MIDMALVVEHLAQHIPEKDAKILGCIAYHESKHDPKAISKKNRNGTHDYGLFQINTVWLKPCKVTPYELLDVRKNIECTITVYNTQGLDAWVTLPKCIKGEDG